MNGLQALITELKTDHSEWEIGLSEALQPDKSSSTYRHDAGKEITQCDLLSWFGLFGFKFCGWYTSFVSYILPSLSPFF